MPRAWASPGSLLRSQACCAALQAAAATGATLRCCCPNPTFSGPAKWRAPRSLSSGTLRRNYGRGLLLSARRRGVGTPRSPVAVAANRVRAQLHYIEEPRWPGPGHDVTQKSRPLSMPLPTAKHSTGTRRLHGARAGGGALLALSRVGGGDPDSERVRSVPPMSSVRTPDGSSAWRRMLIAEKAPRSLAAGGR